MWNMYNYDEWGTSTTIIELNDLWERGMHTIGGVCNKLLVKTETMISTKISS